VLRLSPKEHDILVELFNIGMGKAASSLSSMLKQKILLEIPEIDIISVDELIRLVDYKDKTFDITHLDFSGKINGRSALVLDPESVANLTQSITGEIDPTQSKDIVTEVGNIVVNSLLGSVSNILETSLEYTPPVYINDALSPLFEDILAGPFQVITLLIKASLHTDTDKINAQVFVIFTFDSLESFRPIWELLDTPA
jgi:chemotaxis protein CheC